MRWKSWNWTKQLYWIIGEAHLPCSQGSAPASRSASPSHSSSCLAGSWLLHWGWELCLSGSGSQSPSCSPHVLHPWGLYVPASWQTWGLTLGYCAHMHASSWVHSKKTPPTVSVLKDVCGQEMENDQYQLYDWIVLNLIVVLDKRIYECQMLRNDVLYYINQWQCILLVVTTCRCSCPCIIILKWYRLNCEGLRMVK